MKKNQLIILLLLLLMVHSCSTGKKSFERGNYYEAVIKSIERLRSNPDNKQAKQILKEAYPYALETLTIEIDNLLISNDPYKYAEVVERYEKINSMADEIRRCPAAKSIKLNIKEFTSQLRGAREKAAEESYMAGVELLKKGDRVSAREAYFLFENANNYYSNFRDVRAKMEEAKINATIAVVVEKIPVPGLYKINSDFFQNEIISYLTDKLENNFVLFLNPKEAKQLGFSDQILVMQFDNFVVGSTHDREVVKNLVSKDSVKTGTATIGGQEVDVYNRVKANYTAHTREVKSSGILDVKIIDASSNKVLNNKKFPGEYVWKTLWSTFNGDERALNKEQLNLSKRKAAIPPPPQELFLEFTKPIYNQTRSYLYNFYKQY